MPRKKRRKAGRYSNIKRVSHDGHRFDSQRECERYRELRLMERAGVIRDLELQPRIPIVIGGVQVRYPSGRRMTYVADFRYWDIERDRRVIEDVKMASGFRTEIYKIKRALVWSMGLEILET